MESWEDGWDRLLEEANRQLQKKSKRIQDAWKGIYAGMNSYAMSQFNSNPDSQANRNPGEDSHQSDFTSHVYGEQPIRRAGTGSPQEAAPKGAGEGIFSEDRTNRINDRSQKHNSKGNYATDGLDRKAPDGKAPDRRASGRKLPDQLQQLLNKIQRDSSSPFVDYRLQRNPIYQLNFYDESYHFYEQAAFMADYEDNCPYEGEIGQIFWPTYQKLDVAQLRGYFTWRTKVRRVYEAYRAAGGTVSSSEAANNPAMQKAAESQIDADAPETVTQEIVAKQGGPNSGTVEWETAVANAPLCYKYLYVYEIINQVGVDSPEDGYRRLKYFEANLDGRKSGIGPHLKEWLFDYVIYYQLDRSLLSETDRVKMDQALAVLLDLQEHTPQEVLEAAAVLSTYRIHNSGYYREHPEQYSEILYHVLTQMVSYYEKNRKNGFWESLFGVPCMHPHEMFEGAMFYDRHINLRNSSQEIHFALDDLCSFDYARGRWRCDGYYRIEKNLTLGQIMCAVDAELRTQYQYEFPIRNTLEIKYLNNIVVREVHRQWKEEERRRKQEEQAAKAKERWKKQEESRQRRLEAEQKLKEEERLRQEAERKAREIVLDFSKLDEIRRAAEVTQQRLLVEESETVDAGLPQRKMPETEKTVDEELEAARQSRILEKTVDTELDALRQSRMPEKQVSAGNSDVFEIPSGMEQTAGEEEKEFRIAENQGDIEIFNRGKDIGDEEITHIETNGETTIETVLQKKDDAGNLSGETLVNGIALTAAEAYILRALLDGQDYKAYFQSHHLMTSLVVEALNEKLYDEIGDIVIDFDGEEPVLVEDYLDDIRTLITE